MMPSVVTRVANTFVSFFNISAGSGEGERQKKEKTADDDDDDGGDGDGKQRGFMLWINRRCSFMVVSASVLSIILYPGEATVSLPATALINAIVGKLLKKLIDQQRPVGATGCSKTKGMPSSHANSLFFFATALTLRAAAAAHAPPHGMLLPWMVCAFTYGYAVMIAFIRCTLARQHTVPQVVVGACLGMSTAYCTESYLRPYWL